METIRTAVIGCGKVAHAHAGALSTLPTSHLVAVCDSDGERAAGFGRRYGARPYTDPEEMVVAKAVQMVSICTPHPSHAGLVEMCARRGVHPLVEKPLAPDLGDCDRAISACEAAGVKLGVISQRRLYRPVVRMKEAIDRSAIGRPILATLTLLGWRDKHYYESDPWRGTWASEGGGVMVNQAPHQLDLLQWILGPIDELFGYWDNLSHPYIEVEDTATALIRFCSGALASVVLSNSQNPGLYGRIHVHGSNGASIGVQTEAGSSFISGISTQVEPPINDIWTVPGEEHLLAVWQAADRDFGNAVDIMTHYHQRQIEDFLGAIAEDRPPLVDGRDGRKSVEVITAVYRSQRDGRPVKFPLKAEAGRDDRDGRLTYVPLSRRAGPL